MSYGYLLSLELLFEARDKFLLLSLSASDSSLGSSL
jgi:hypothetical protein